MAPSSRRRHHEPRCCGPHRSYDRQRGPFASGERQIQAFSIMECENIDRATERANRLPTYGYVEVRELLQY